jgi:hypothetical protein
MDDWRRVFLGPHGLRAGWRLLLFVAISTAITGVPFLALQSLGLKPAGPLNVGMILSGELLQFAGCLAAVAIMARVERRRIAAYGLTGRGAFGGLFWQGMLWGIASVSAVVGLIALRGGYTLGSPALAGGALARFAASWLMATVAIGLFEELQYRGYALFTLATGVGFRLAAILISLDFAAEHFFSKPFENWADVSSVGLIGLFFCLTVRRTGNLWFAIGWHAAFNFGQFFVYGCPNSANRGRPFEGHLFDSSFHGPEWLTGGRLGIEASLMVFPVIVLLFALFPLVYRRTLWPGIAAPRQAEILELPCGARRAE